MPYSYVTLSAPCPPMPIWGKNMLFIIYHKVLFRKDLFDILQKWKCAIFCNISALWYNFKGKSWKKLQTHTYNTWMPRESFTGQNLNKSLNTHWTNNPCKKNMPQELSKYITYILCCESWAIFTHIQLIQVILSWNKLFSSYWNLK